MRQFIIRYVRIALISIVVVCLLSCDHSEMEVQTFPQIIDLWPDGAPNNNGITEPEEEKDGRLYNISKAMLYYYPASIPNGMVIVMCPGGGYDHLSINHEGIDGASIMNNLGISFAVLKYRLPNGNIEVPISDGLKAIEMLRVHCREYGICPNRIGIMGASSGGNLASLVSTRYSSKTNRPDFTVLLYAVTGLDINPELMIGPNASDEVKELYTSFKHITSSTPPTFLACSSDDGVVSIENSINYYEALKKHDVTSEMQIYPSGGHGWGFSEDFPYHDTLIFDLYKWLMKLP